MVSKLAIAEADDMAAKGKPLSFAESVRLNDLGIAAEREQGAETMEAPRVAILGGVVFREPTLGSEIWFSRACSVFDKGDGDTLLQIRALSVCMDIGALPSPYDVDAVSAAASALQNRLTGFTLRQIVKAIHYAIGGYGESQDDDCGADGCADDDGGTQGGGEGEDCFAAGLIVIGRAYAVGTAEEMAAMRPCELMRVIQLKQRLQGVDANKAKGNNALGAFYSYVDKLRNERGLN